MVRDQVLSTWAEGSAPQYRERDLDDDYAEEDGDEDFDDEILYGDSDDDDNSSDTSHRGSRSVDLEDRVAEQLEKINKLEEEASQLNAE